MLSFRCTLSSDIWKFLKTLVLTSLPLTYFTNKTEAEQLSNTIMNIDINMEKSTFYNKQL